MATAAKRLALPHIVKKAGHCGGKAAIDQTRIRVNNVVWLHKQGRTPEEICVVYPDLTLAQVHAALSYYYDHRDEIETELAAEDGAEERYEQARAAYLARRPAR